MDIVLIVTTWACLLDWDLRSSDAPTSQISKVGMCVFQVVLSNWGRDGNYVKRRREMTEKRFLVSGWVSHFISALHMHTQHIHLTHESHWSTLQNVSHIQTYPIIPQHFDCVFVTPPWVRIPVADLTQRDLNPTLDELYIPKRQPSQWHANLKCWKRDTWKESNRQEECLTMVNVFIFR